ncbi:hypothetical protein D3C72_1562690 [compost metagenome]
MDFQRCDAVVLEVTTRRLHLVQPVFHDADILGCAPLGGEGGGADFERPAHVEQAFIEVPVGLGIEVPGEDLRVKEAPAAGQGDAGADLGARLDQALGLERLERLAQHRARHAIGFHHHRIAGEDRAHRILAGDDALADFVDDEGMEIPCSGSPGQRANKAACFDHATLSRATLLRERRRQI